MTKTQYDLNTEHKIMQAATELFAKNGFDGTSTREICKLAEVNISLISYYFGGKKELYKKIIDRIVQNIIKYAMKRMDVQELPQNFDFIPREQKIQMLFKSIDMIIDYFYSGNISEAEIMIIFREQMSSGVPIDTSGYLMFKKLLASILEKDENDKEIIFRTITIIGQVQSARIFKQFSLNIMGQSAYSKEDIIMLKQIVMSQVQSILNQLITGEGK